MSRARKRVVVFISGGGSNMLSLLEATKAADFPAEIVAVVSDKPEAGGLAKARAEGIATYAFARRDYPSKADHEMAILGKLSELQPDLICLAGYMRLLSADFIQAYAGAILNIHPSLLPLFAGLHTHERALDAGMRVAGCTVHFVTEGMDEGPIIAQGVVPVMADDTAETLASRVLTVEHQLYPMALRAVALGEVRMDDAGNTVRTGSNADPAARILSS
ncbi:phosphoribosylglycinamide formyltransferase [Rhizobium halophytocola]|uniref:Phosphoribosylglycinamide formyltransferase n=1 Tax=Rhizobium halophytocola TaxID=735519 RepID=A0ABS4DYE7_9HYPH|nr:phosphoribosylglycinamide formyltransferase-1 [Rhizobium halophytocola]